MQKKAGTLEWNGIVERIGNIFLHAPLLSFPAIDPLRKSIGGRKRNCQLFPLPLSSSFHRPVGCRNGKWDLGKRRGRKTKQKKKPAPRESRTLLLTRDWTLVEMVRLNAELQKELQEELQRELQRGKVMDQKMAHVAWKPATDGRWGGPIV